MKQIAQNPAISLSTAMLEQIETGNILKNILLPFKPSALNARPRNKQRIITCMQQSSASTSVDDESTLVGAAQRGDLTAYRKLYETHLAMVYGLACRLVKDRSAAEDVTQEVFIKVWKDMSSFRGESKFSTWLHRICTLTAISHLRRQRSWLQRVITDDDAIPEATDTSPGSVDLESYVRRLPERARIVFVLHAIEGYPHEQIARVCDMAVGTSKAQFHRAKQLLEEWMI